MTIQAAFDVMIINRYQTFNGLLSCYSDDDFSVPTNLTSFAVHMQIRPQKGSATLILELSTSNSRLTITGTSHNQITMYIAPEDTADLPVCNAHYDIVISNGTDSERILEGIVEIKDGVTIDG